MHRYPLLQPLVLIVFLFALTAQSAQAWKPTTHVYLALQVVDELLSTTCSFDPGDGSAPVTFNKAAGELCIFRVDYKTGEQLALIGTYAVDPALVSALENHLPSFIAGVLGPDAYPDMVTGQTRIHPDDVVYNGHRILTNEWLEHIWERALDDGQPQVLAFAAGYLTHASGDMFMHTFVNHFAGGAFAFPVNGLKHMVFEGYIGKRAPKLPDDIFDLELDPAVKDFVFDTLVDAKPGSRLAQLMVNVDPRDVTNDDGDPNQISYGSLFAIPPIYSSLRYGLEAEVDHFNRTVDNFDEAFEATQDSLDALADAGVCNPALPLPGDLCAEQLAQGVLIIAQKEGYILTNGAQAAFMAEWAEDIRIGLEAWVDLNHEVGKALLFNVERSVDRNEITDLFNTYKNQHFLAMNGVPDGVGGTLDFIEQIKEVFFPEEIREQINMIRDDLIDQFILARFDTSLDEVRFILGFPELRFEIMNQPCASEDLGCERPSTLIDMGTLNRQFLGIDDDGFEFGDTRFWDVLDFEPAYNTMTINKLLLLSAGSVQDLRTDLDCDAATCPFMDNAMLGFLDSIDKDNQWLLDTQNEQMVFGMCDQYTQMFKAQAGELAPCPSRLAPPTLTPGGTFNAPVTVTIFHELGDDVDVYYTINDAGQVVEPTNDPNDPLRFQRSTKYEQPFLLSAPFVGQVRPLVVAARAFKDGAFVPSATVEEAYTIDAQLPAPTFFPDLDAFTTLVNIDINGPQGASLFYTTDGSDPDYNDIPYTGAIQFGVGTHTLKAVAYRIGFPQSPVVTKTFTVYSASANRVADPILTPGSGQFTPSVQVTMTSSTQDAQIRYTTAKDQVPDNPTQNSQLYTGPVELGLGNWFVRVIAFRNGLPPSNLVQRNYNVSTPLGTTAITGIEPNGGTFNNDIEVTITAATDPPTQGVRIFYTTDTSDPVIDPQRAGNYSEPFDLGESTTVKAAATRTFFTNSAIASADFRFVAATPQIEPALGSFLDGVEVTMTSETEEGEIRYTTDGTEPNDTSTLYAGPFTLTSSATVKAVAFKDDYFFSETASANLIVGTSAPPVVARQPEDRVVTVGERVGFVVRATGVPTPTVQWQRNGTAIDGATSDTLTIASVTLDDAGVYQALLTNASGTDTTRSANLIVNPEAVPPQIVTQPIGVEVQVGEAVVLAVEATGEPEPTFIWLRNGTALPAQTDNVLAFPSVELVHAGAYQAVAVNSAGADSSTVVMITLLFPDAITEVSPEVPKVFGLRQNYPNPFNPTTVIPFDVAEQAQVVLKLYDIMGRELAILANEELRPGSYEATLDATGLTSGVYFCRMEAKGRAWTRKMMLVR